ncbi:11531_t:CDS:2 [Funneliformis caledonium]|uniref:11531_t:CDS:1 n=1 Tax=Funneliformis caledonium TaxID=1117310 RepID=A0A9N9H551_9GLOM|nr:11531_t:CDS:2 [Funneliformis caledonium]
MSERTSIILFGLTGEGKSTISNMLIQGDIHYESNAFEVNDTAAGVSLNVNCSFNERFIVYDTIGLGEPSYGTVPHRNAVREIRNYFSVCGVPLNYIAYVKKKGRITDKDREMFKILKDIFTGGEKNVIIIITDGNQAWVEKNSEKLKNFGDYPIIPGIVLEVLSSNQKTENKVVQIIEIIPVVGSSYQLISSGVYYTMGKSNLAKERLKNGAIGVVIDVTCVGALREGAIVGKAAYKGIKAAAVYTFNKSDK